ncbi:MAG TPA: hypothetical protein VK078_02870 [Pseudogracilibacillus sp.]|nr:hypothetical protein [Pseudogracilibacillus sp.]
MKIDFSNGGHHMKMLAISIFIIGVIFLTYIAVSSMIKVLNLAHDRKEISEQSRKRMVALSIIIGILIATLLPIISITLLEFLAS